MKKKVYRERYKTITEEEVQAVANAIVEQAKEDNKTIEEVVNEIVEENKEAKLLEELKAGAEEQARMLLEESKEVIN